jgi:hypothetical protein
MKDCIWDRQTGEQVAWVENGLYVFSIEPEKLIATVRDGRLYALTGKPLVLCLADLLHGTTKGSPVAIAALRKLVTHD